MMVTIFCISIAVGATVLVLDALWRARSDNDN